MPQLVPLQVTNGTLSIAAVERASAGTYTCHASSKEGTVTHTTRVLVQGKDRGTPSPALWAGDTQGAMEWSVLGVAAVIPCPKSSLSLCPAPQGHPSSWCHPRMSLSTSPKMPFWRARLRLTQGTSPTPGSRAAATSSTSGTAGMGMAPGLLCPPNLAPSARDRLGVWWGPIHHPRAAGTVPSVPLTAIPSLPSHLQARVRVLVDGSLLLQRTTPDDAGKYTCTPSNGLWKPPSASAFVTVLCKTPSCTPRLQGL